MPETMSTNPLSSEAREFYWPGYGIKHEFRVIERIPGYPVLQGRAPHRGWLEWKDWGDIGDTTVTPQFIAFLHNLFTAPRQPRCPSCGAAPCDDQEVV